MIAVHVNGHLYIDVVASQLSELMGVTPRKVAEWRREGMPAKRGGVIVHDVVVCTYWVAGRDIAYRAGIRGKFPPVGTTLLGYLVCVDAYHETHGDWLPAARHLGRRAGGSPELVEQLLSMSWLHRKNPMTPNQKESQP